MISDLDDSLAQLLRGQLPAAIVGSTQIVFDAPDDQFPPSGVTLPAIDLFLYDVRENADLRSVEWTVERPAAGNLVMHPPPVRVDCSYLVTAWPSETSPTRLRDEHQLLSEVLKVIVRFPTLPHDVLAGELAGQSPAPPTASLGAGRLQSVAEFWQALGGRPKAALHLTVTIGVDRAAPTDGGPPVSTSVIDLAAQPWTLPAPPGDGD
jgi:Pvc16 N-terminal domain